MLTNLERYENNLKHHLNSFKHKSKNHGKNNTKASGSFFCKVENMEGDSNSNVITRYVRKMQDHKIDSDTTILFKSFFHLSNRCFF